MLTDGQKNMFFLYYIDLLVQSWKVNLSKDGFRLCIALLKLTVRKLRLHLIALLFQLNDEIILLNTFNFNSEI